MKIFKVLNNNKALTKMIHLLNKNDFFYNWRGVFLTLLISLSSLHFCSCFFIFLGKNEYPGWIVLCNLQSDSFHHIYITAVYYLMTTLTTVGYGDILVNGDLERFYQIILLIVGTCAYSWILTFISNYIKKKNERYIDFENKVNILGEIRINYPRLDNDLYERILRYLNYNKSEYKYNIENILDSLPSSLQNRLIVEMYKPIIRNFHFFKYFENSDFFVKIVTSLKPILSMKDDILIQEGEFIEDIIFIKKGVLALEIIIDLDSLKESVEDHLNMTGIGSIKIFSKNETQKTNKDSKINNSFSVVSQNSNMNNINRTVNNSKILNIKEKKINNKKAMRIIDLRKNEHFGDVLMILNEKSPLTVKVKSKKAELFLLQKTDATEISNQYPNIWKRIVNKSLYNMKQIKNLIQKKLIIFCELNDIMINPELKRKYLEINEINNSKHIIDKKNKKDKDRKNKIYPRKKIESIIIEEDEINFDSMMNLYVLNDKNIKKDKKKLSVSSKDNASQKRKSKFDLNDNSNISKSKINNKNRLSAYTLNNDTKINQNVFDISSNKSKSNQHNNNSENQNEKITIEIENNKDNQEKKSSSKNNNSVCNLNNMISIIDEKMKLNKGQINNFNINIFTQKAVQIPINQINNKNNECFSNSNRNSMHYDDKTSAKINEELYFDEDLKINLLNKDILMNNCDKNNDIIYPNLKRLLGNENNNENISNINIKKLLDTDKSNDNSLEKDEIKKNKENTDIINKNISKDIINNNKTNKFLYLDNANTISFSIFSIYENINKLTNYKFDKDNMLQQKTKNFIINNCILRQKSAELSLDSKKIRETHIIVPQLKKVLFQII